MAKLTPLGILSAIGKRLFTFASTSITSFTYLGAAYVPLTNASWFIFGGSNTGTAHASYRYGNTANTITTSGTLPSSKIWGRAATNGTRLLLTPRQSDTTGLYTDNGTSWTSTTIFASSVVIRDVIWDGTYFLVLSEDSANGLAYSTDATSWTRLDTGNGGYTIRYDGTSRYIILEDLSTATHRTCTASPTVAGNWGNITLPASGRWHGLAYGNGIWVAFMNSTDTYATSTDGTTWTSRTFAAGGPNNWSTTSDYNAQIVFANGYFYIAEGNGADTGDVWASADGINWTLQTFTYSSDIRYINAWAFSSDAIIGVGYANSTDGSLVGYLGS